MGMVHDAIRKQVINRVGT